MKQRRRSGKQNYATLENRVLLASADYVGFDLTLHNFRPDEIVSISESGDNVIYSLSSGDTWQGAEVDGMTGLDTSVLTIDRSQILPRTGIDGSSSENTDVFYATDALKSPTSIFGVRNITQAPGTSVAPRGSISGQWIKLTEPGNLFRGDGIGGDYAELFSEQAIDLDGINLSNGVIASAASITIGANTDFRGIEIDGQFTLDSGESIGIYNDRIGVTGRLNLKATNDITIRSYNSYVENLGLPFNGDSELTRLNFQAGGFVDMTLTEYGGEFSSLSPSNLSLMGDNFAQNFKLNYQAAVLTNAPGATFEIAQNADADVHRIFIANNSSDRFHVGQRAWFNAWSIYANIGIPILQHESSVWIGEPGDVRFGWFRSDNPTWLTLHEDDSTFLTRIGGSPGQTQLITVRSGGDIEVYRRGLIESRYTVNMFAGGSIEALPEDVTVRGTRFTLEGQSIEMSIDSSSVNFNSPGFVRLQSNNLIAIEGQNTANAVSLIAANRVVSVADASLDTGWLHVSAKDIWLANQSKTERISVAGRANLFAESTSVIGRLGIFESSRLNFSATSIDLTTPKGIQFTGNNTARNAILRAVGPMTDSAGTRFTIRNQLELTAPAVWLADDLDDEFEVCAHVNFFVDEFASIHREGVARIGTWRVVGEDAGSWINPDSRGCSSS